MVLDFLEVILDAAEAAAQPAGLDEEAGPGRKLSIYSEKSEMILGESKRFSGVS